MLPFHNISDFVYFEILEFDSSQIEWNILEYAQFLISGARVSWLSQNKRLVLYWRQLSKCNIVMR